MLEKFYSKVTARMDAAEHAGRNRSYTICVASAYQAPLLSQSGFQFSRDCIGRIYCWFLSELILIELVECRLTRSLGPLWVGPVGMELTGGPRVGISIGQTLSLYLKHLVLTYPKELGLGLKLGAWILVLANE